MKVNHRLTSKARRTVRVRSRVRGTTERPRLTVFRSNKYVYLQVINDEQGTTLASISPKAKAKKTGTKTEMAKTVAQDLANTLKKANITKLVFDRGSYKYHGRVRVIAETMREQGIEV
jgi:large subunit ribosomal protein L18